jgi:murein DD-endopeptidase MepM/ murein hydrolase activator NlpD
VSGYKRFRPNFSGIGRFFSKILGRNNSTLKNLSLSRRRGILFSVNFKSFKKFLSYNAQAAFMVLAGFILLPSVAAYGLPAIGGSNDSGTTVNYKTVAELASNTEEFSGDEYNMEETIITVDNDYLFQTGGIETIISKNNRNGVINYQVKDGESVGSLASDFGLSAETIRYNNGLSGNTLKAGQTLLITPVDGLMAKVDRGDTLSSISQRYNISLDNINKYNPDLAGGASIHAGDKVFIPGAVVPKASYTPTSKSGGAPTQHEASSTPRSNPNKGASGLFAWPTSTASHYLSQGFGHTKYESNHTGIDLPKRFNGTGAFAAAAGIAHVQSTRNGYGNLVIIEHAGGYETYYAHLASFTVSNGQHVNQGDLVGYIGNTGNSTGPHLHFEVRIGGRPVNPIAYLP